MEVLQLLLSRVPGWRERRMGPLGAWQCYGQREWRGGYVLLVEKDGEGVSARLVQRERELESLEVGGDAAVFFAEEHRLLGMMVLDGELDVGLDRVGEET